MCPAADSSAHIPADLILLLPDGRRIACHRRVLCAQSARLRALLEVSGPGAAIPQQLEVPVQGVDSNAMQAVLGFFYTQQLVLSPGSVLAVLDCVVKLEVASVISACERFIQTVLSPSTCPVLLDQSLLFQQEHLTVQLLSWCSPRLPEVCITPEFLAITEQALCRILIAAHQAAAAGAVAWSWQSKGGHGWQKQLFHTVMAWVGADPSGRSHLTPVLLQAAGLAAQGTQPQQQGQVMAGPCGGTQPVATSAPSTQHGQGVLPAQPTPSFEAFAQSKAVARSTQPHTHPSAGPAHGATPMQPHTSQLPLQAMRQQQPCPPLPPHASHCHPGPQRIKQEKGASAAPGNPASARPLAHTDPPPHRSGPAAPSAPQRSSTCSQPHVAVAQPSYGSLVPAWQSLAPSPASCAMVTVKAEAEEWEAVLPSASHASAKAKLDPEAGATPQPQAEALSQAHAAAWGLEPAADTATEQPTALPVSENSHRGEGGQLGPQDSPPCNEEPAAQQLQEGACKAPDNQSDHKGTISLLGPQGGGPDQRPRLVNEAQHDEPAAEVAAVVDFSGNRRPEQRHLEEQRQVSSLGHEQQRRAAQAAGAGQSQVQVPDLESTGMASKGVAQVILQLPGGGTRTVQISAAMLSQLLAQESEPQPEAQAAVGKALTKQAQPLQQHSSQRQVQAMAPVMPPAEPLKQEPEPGTASNPLVIEGDDEASSCQEPVASPLLRAPALLPAGAPSLRLKPSLLAGPPASQPWALPESLSRRPLEGASVDRPRPEQSSSRGSAHGKEHGASSPVNRQNRLTAGKGAEGWAGEYSGDAPRLAAGSEGSGLLPLSCNIPSFQLDSSTGVAIAAELTPMLDSQLLRTSTQQQDQTVAMAAAWPQHLYDHTSALPTTHPLLPSQGPHSTSLALPPLHILDCLPFSASAAPLRPPSTLCGAALQHPSFKHLDQGAGAKAESGAPCLDPQPCSSNPAVAPAAQARYHALESLAAAALVLQSKENESMEAAPTTVPSAGHSQQLAAWQPHSVHGEAQEEHGRPQPPSATHPPRHSRSIYSPEFASLGRSGLSRAEGTAPPARPDCEHAVLAGKAVLLSNNVDEDPLEAAMQAVERGRSGSQAPDSSAASVGRLQTALAPDVNGCGLTTARVGKMKAVKGCEGQSNRPLTGTAGFPSPYAARCADMEAPQRRHAMQLPDLDLGSSALGYATDRKKPSSQNRQPDQPEALTSGLAWPAGRRTEGVAAAMHKVLLDLGTLPPSPASRAGARVEAPESGYLAAQLCQRVGGHRDARPGAAPGSSDLTHLPLDYTDLNSRQASDNSAPHSQGCDQSASAGSGAGGGEAGCASDMDEQRPWDSDKLNGCSTRAGKRRRRGEARAPDRAASFRLEPPGEPLVSQAAWTGLKQFAGPAAGPGACSGTTQAPGYKSEVGVLHLPSAPNVRGVCHVDNCYADLSGLRDYHQRFKICDYHLKCIAVLREGQPQRFCQQCGRFHPVSEFDGVKRSCRTRLQRHNARRRKKGETADPEPAPVMLGQTCSGQFAGNRGEGGVEAMPAAFPLLLFPDSGPLWLGLPSSGTQSPPTSSTYSLAPFLDPMPLMARTPEHHAPPYSGTKQAEVCAGTLAANGHLSFAQGYSQQVVPRTFDHRPQRVMEEGCTVDWPQEAAGATYQLQLSNPELKELAPGPNCVPPRACHKAPKSMSAPNNTTVLAGGPALWCSALAAQQQANQPWQLNGSGSYNQMTGRQPVGASSPGQLNTLPAASSSKAALMGDSSHSSASQTPRSSQQSLSSTQHATAAQEGVVSSDPVLGAATSSSHARSQPLSISYVAAPCGNSSADVICILKQANRQTAAALGSCAPVLARPGQSQDTTLVNIKVERRRWGGKDYLNDSP